MEQYIQCGDIAENPLYVKELGIHIYPFQKKLLYFFLEWVYTFKVFYRGIDFKGKSK